MTPDDPAFWDFDVSDHAVGDYPAMISYIHNLTDLKVTVMAHSLGSMSITFLMADKPEFVEEHVASVHLNGPTPLNPNVTSLPYDPAKNLRE